MLADKTINIMKLALVKVFFFFSSSLWFVIVKFPIKNVILHKLESNINPTNSTTYLRLNLRMLLWFCRHEQNFRFLCYRKDLQKKYENIQILDIIY